MAILSESGESGGQREDVADEIEDLSAVLARVGLVSEFHRSGSSLVPRPSWLVAEVAQIRLKGMSTLLSRRLSRLG